MKVGDYLVCHTEMPGPKFDKNLFTINKKYKILEIYDYREHQQKYFNFLFTRVETNIGDIQFINYEYKNYLCSVKKFRKKKLDFLKNIL